MTMPTDKILHLLAGIAIATLVYPFGILWAIAAVFIAAIGKETYDSTGRGHVELLNAVATVAGWAGGVVFRSTCFDCLTTRGKK